MAQQQEKKVTGLQAFNRTINSPETQKYLSDVLGDRKMSFVNNLIALVSNDAKLQVCEPYTLMFAAMKATSLNLPLDNSLGFAYVIPYKDNNRGVTVAQFQMGYKGYKQLALRTGMFAIIPNATDVREGELVSHNRLTGEYVFDFIDDIAERESKPIIGYASYFKLRNGAESTFYMSRDDMERHALHYSQTYRSKDPKIKASSKWTTEFDDMAMKTVIKLNLSKNAPLSVEMKDALQADQAVQFERNKYDYMDNDKAEIDMARAQELASKFDDFQDVTDEPKK